VPSNICLNCGQALSSDTQRAYAYCGPKCQSKHMQEMRAQKNAQWEYEVLMKQYEEQRRGR